MVAAGITVHAIFALLGVIPSERPALGDQVAFAIDYTFWLNCVFLMVAAVLLSIHWRGSRSTERGKDGSRRASGPATGS